MSYKSHIRDAVSNQNLIHALEKDSNDYIHLIINYGCEFNPNKLNKYFEVSKITVLNGRTKIGIKMVHPE